MERYIFNFAIENVNSKEFKWLDDHLSSLLECISNKLTSNHKLTSKQSKVIKLLESKPILQKGEQLTKAIFKCLIFKEEQEEENDIIGNVVIKNTDSIDSDPLYVNYILREFLNKFRKKEYIAYTCMRAPVKNIDNNPLGFIGIGYYITSKFIRSVDTEEWINNQIKRS